MSSNYFTDQELLSRAQNRDAFPDLHNGHIAAFDSLPEAVRAYRQILEREQRGYSDPDQIERLLRQSDLVPTGWDEEGIIEIEVDPERDEDNETWQSEVISSLEVYIEDESPINREIAHFAAHEIASSERVIVIAESETLWVYDSATGLWKDIGKQVVRRLLHAGVGNRFTNHLFREVREQIKAEAMISRDELGVPSGTIAVKNGLLDLDERSLRSLRPDDYATWRLPVEYDPQADCPEFEAFLTEICDTDDLPMLQEFLGYCLDHAVIDHKKALMLFGPTDAGKSVFLDVIRDFFGNENGASYSPQYLANERWGQAGLVGYPVNIRHDLDPNQIENLGKMKEIIAGNTVIAERKGESPFEVSLTTKHLFAANRAPERKADDDAFWNRWLTVIIPESVPRDAQDPQLTEKLTTDDELSGLLNWALDGYDRLREQGQFTNEPSSEATREKWHAYGNPIEQFIHTEIAITGDQTDDVPKDLVYDAYTQFADRRGFEVEDKGKLTRELKKKSGIDDSERRIDGERQYCYTGVKLVIDE